MTDWGNVPKFPWRDDATLRQQFPEPAVAPGARIAWSEATVGGVTVGISPVHRAMNGETALCGASIPGEVRRVQVLKNMRACGRCELAHAELQFGASA